MSTDLFAPTPFQALQPKDTKEGQRVRKLARLYNVAVMDWRQEPDDPLEQLLMGVVMPFNLGRFVLWNISWHEIESWFKLHPDAFQLLDTFCSTVNDLRQPQLRDMARRLGKNMSETDNVMRDFGIVNVRCKPWSVAEDCCPWVKRTPQIEYLLLRHNPSLLKHKDRFDRMQTFVHLKMEVCMCAYMLKYRNDHNMLLVMLIDILSASPSHREKMSAQHLAAEFGYDTQEQFENAVMWKLDQQRRLIEALDKELRGDGDDEEHELNRKLIKAGLLSPHASQHERQHETKAQKIFKLINNQHFIETKWGKTKKVLMLEYDDFLYLQNKHRCSQLVGSQLDDQLQRIHETTDSHSHRLFTVEDLVFKKWWNAKSEWESDANRSNFDIALDFNPGVVKILVKLNNYPLLFSAEVMTLLNYTLNTIASLTRSLARRQPALRPPLKKLSFDMYNPEKSSMSFFDMMNGEASKPALFAVPEKPAKKSSAAPSPAPSPSAKKSSAAPSPAPVPLPSPAAKKSSTAPSPAPSPAAKKSSTAPSPAPAPVPSPAAKKSSAPAPAPSPAAKKSSAPSPAPAPAPSPAAKKTTTPAPAASPAAKQTAPAPAASPAAKKTTTPAPAPAAKKSSAPTPKTKTESSFVFPTKFVPSPASFDLPKNQGKLPRSDSDDGSDFENELAGIEFMTSFRSPQDFK